MTSTPTEIFDFLVRMPNSGEEVRELAEHFSLGKRDDSLTWWGRVGEILSHKAFNDARTLGMPLPFDAHDMKEIIGEVEPKPNNRGSIWRLYHLSFTGGVGSSYNTLTSKSMNKAVFSREQLAWEKGDPKPVYRTDTKSYSSDEMRDLVTSSRGSLRELYFQLFRKPSLALGVPATHYKRLRFPV